MNLSENQSSEQDDPPVYNPMKIFRNSFNSDHQMHRSSSGQEKIEAPAEEQIDFANSAIDIFNQALKEFQFKLYRVNIATYGTRIIWVNRNRYVTLCSNTHPHDAPYYYGIGLGEFSEGAYHYLDRDCVGLWRLKAIEENLANVDDKPFPYGVDMQPSLIQVREELFKYGRKFLEGDLTAFYYARNKQWDQ